MMTSAAPEPLPISVVILTKNEEAVVGRAISSARRDYAEVIVVDSYSDDRTVEVAQRAGATVVQHAFTGYASQRNFALKEMRRANEWVFFLDADEVISREVTSELRRDFSRIVSEGYGMAYVRRKDYFMGRWIRHSSGYPTWFGRLCRSPAVRIEREVNEEYRCELPVARLSGHLLHYPFDKGVSRWVERHNRYSTAEAEECTGASTSVHELARLVCSRDPGLRRKGLKHVYMRLPLRPVIGFLYLYVVLGGYLDGVAGLRYAALRGFYEFLIDLKREELHGRELDGAR